MQTIAQTLASCRTAADFDKARDILVSEIANAKLATERARKKCTTAPFQDPDADVAALQSAATEADRAVVFLQDLAGELERRRTIQAAVEAEQQLQCRIAAGRKIYNALIDDYEEFHELAEKIVRVRDRILERRAQISVVDNELRSLGRPADAIGDPLNHLGAKIRPAQGDPVGGMVVPDYVPRTGALPPLFAAIGTVFSARR